jgi:outer membrane receptor for ferrienterochelin and colicins
MVSRFFVWLLISATAAAQPAAGTLHVEVRGNGGPVANAEVIVAAATHRTDAAGTVSITAAAGTLDVTVAKDGFVPVTSSIQVQAGGEQRVVVELQMQPTIEEEVLVVASTRTSRGLEEQPVRVDVLPREEIEEKMMMTPGDIVMMMNEMGGMRVQATSPSLGAASVRIQGMRGRYTRFLSDGLPLFGEVGGLGLLQIPPMDLGQVEVIKGVASSMYGAGAMGGVVNLISRRPGAEPVREFLINRSTRGGTDTVGFYGTPVSERWGLTLLGGGHWQQRADVNHDSWSDLPRYARGVFRPRVYWNGGNGRTFFATTGVTVENREGGTEPGAVLPPPGERHVERLDTRRFDTGMVGQLPWKRFFITARAAFSQQRHTHQFGEALERDRHNFAFGEVALRGTVGRHAWVVGAAAEHDVYRPIDLTKFGFQFTIPGLFLQDDVEIASWLSVSASGRLDHHSEYGTFVSPRIAALVRTGRWNSRVSVGTGFFGPSALTEETEAAGLSRLTIPHPLNAEEGRSASFDVTRTDGPLSYTLTLFASRVLHAIDVERETAFTLTNAAEPATNVGAELLATFRREPYAVTATYTHVRAREYEFGRGMTDAALTPHHSAGLVGMWEREEVGRVGVELYYTGIQQLEADPFAGRSEPYVIVGLLAERQFGAWRLFINGENLSGVRQTRWHPLIRPSRAPDGRWTVDAWAPLDGRTVNGGIRLRF